MDQQQDQAGLGRGRGGGGVAQAAVDEPDGGKEHRRRAQRQQEAERAVGIWRRGLRRWRGTRTRLGVEEAEDFEGDEPGAQVDEARRGSSVHHGARGLRLS